MNGIGTWTLVGVCCVITYALSNAILKLRLRQISKLFDSTLKNIGEDSVFMPSLVYWKDEIQKYYDLAISDQLIYKKRPAKKAADEVKEARTLAREQKKEFLLLRNRLALYESIAPWLADHVEMTVDEFVSAMREAKEFDENSTDEESDPIEKYVPKTEWSKLSQTKRNQLALDRYLDPNRKKDLWKIGIDYERFVGYQYEKKGFKVIYHGAINAKEDLGIDLICEGMTEILAIQCKRLSPSKAIPVRENVIAQIFGASRYYEMKLASGKKVRPVLYTTFQLSEEAREFAKFLKVECFENFELKKYPLIKCNISGANEKIYHLPMDQQYDRVVIGDREGEFYAKTVAEAEKSGFRRAYRWRGN